MNETIEVGLPVKRGPGRPRKEVIADSPALDCQTIVQLQHWAYRLELANAMKAGLMDSESRHDEVARQRHAIVEAVIAEMRAL